MDTFLENIKNKSIWDKDNPIFETQNDFKNKTWLQFDPTRDLSS